MDENSTGEGAPRLLNLGLNDGTYCPQACIDLLQTFNTRTSLRNYTTAENDPLLAVISEVDGVRPEHIYLANGSGILLKQCIPYIIREKILGSPRRMVRHVVMKTGYPIITASFTYGKVPAKGIQQGLKVDLIPMGPDDGFRLDPEALRAALNRHEGLVYIANPNNPTGNVLINRTDLEALLQEHPQSLFWIDEAYVQYVDPAHHRPVSDLVPKYTNLIVSRTFSFAYGLAGLRIGYLLARPDLIQVFKSQVVDYRLGLVQEQMAIAALRDPEHLGFIRRESAEQREVLIQGVNAIPGLQAFPSEANFVLCRFTDGRKGSDLAEKMMARGIKIKTISALQNYRFDEWFRITLGIAPENRLFLENLREIVQG